MTKLNSTGHLATWQYHVLDAVAADPISHYDDLEGKWGIAPVLRDLELSDRMVAQGGHNEAKLVLHMDPQQDVGGPDQEGRRPVDRFTYQVDGKTYRATGAHFAISPLML